MFWQVAFSHSPICELAEGMLRLWAGELLLLSTACLSLLMHSPPAGRCVSLKVDAACVSLGVETSRASVTLLQVEINVQRQPQAIQAAIVGIDRLRLMTRPARVLHVQSPCA